MKGGWKAAGFTLVWAAMSMIVSAALTSALVARLNDPGSGASAARAGSNRAALDQRLKAKLAETRGKYPQASELSNGLTIPKGGHGFCVGRQRLVRGYTNANGTGAMDSGSSVIKSLGPIETAAECDGTT